jgi:hypothetical protein
MLLDDSRQPIEEEGPVIQRGRAFVMSDTGLMCHLAILPIEL